MLKYIFKYDPNNTITHLTSVQVDDNHVLSDDELETLPNGFMTPAKLVNGKLTSATADESNQAAQNYLEQSGINNEQTTPTVEQQFQAQMLVSMANMQQQITDLQQKVGGTNNVSND